MDASQLRSEISSLQRECSQLEHENATMQREINAIASSAQSAASTLTRTCHSATSTLEKSTNVIEYSDQTLHEVIAEQEHIEVLYRGFKNIETANKKIRELNNKIYFEFANFRMVRKIVRAFIDNINLDMIKMDLIYKSVEKEHLQSPDFWLSAAMLAIMHWKEDNKDAASRALNQAMKLDDKQATLFFMSFNLLLGRKDAALKWFDYYQKIEKTGDDAGFILLLLHAVNLNEDDSDAFTKKIKAYLIKEYDNSKSMNDIGEMVELIKDHLVQYNSSETFVFDTLRNHLKDYSTMASVLAMAKDNSAIIDFVETTNTSSRSRGYIYIEKFINQILETPDKKERVYTDEIAYNEAIIRCVGNLADAEEEFKAKHEHDVSALNLMSECIDWLFGGRSLEFSPLARYNMFILCRDLIEQAAEKYFEEYRSKHKNVHPASIKDYSTDMNFKNKAQELKKVESFYARKRESQLATVKNTAIILCIVFASLSLVGGIASFIVSAQMGMGMVVLAVALFVLAVILGISAIVNFFGKKKKIKNIMQNTEISLSNALQIVENLFNEYAQYLVAYEESDHIAQDIIFAIKR